MSRDFVVLPIDLRDFAKSLVWHLLEAGLRRYQMVRLGTIKNPQSLEACGFWCCLGLLGIPNWYREPESNRHGVTTARF